MATFAKGKNHSSLSDNGKYFIDIYRRNYILQFFSPEGVQKDEDVQEECSRRLSAYIKE